MSVYVTETVFILNFPITLAVMEAVLSKSSAYDFQANNPLEQHDIQQIETSLHGHLQAVEMKFKHLLRS